MTDTLHPFAAADPVEAAIERGDATGRLLIGFRDQLFEPMAGLLLICGADGLRAAAAGVAEAVIAAHGKRNPAQEETPHGR